MRIKICGKYWNLRFVRNLKAARDDPHHGRPIRGECDGPHVSDKQIKIDKGLQGSDRLTTILHECMHAGLWHLDEEVVDELSTDLGALLWRLEYRAPSDLQAGL